MPRVRVSVDDYSLLTAALEGLQLQKQRIEDQIRHVRARLSQGTPRRGRPAGTNSAVKVTGRKLSVAARKRIAAAQKRRWAEYRKASAAKG